MLNIFHSPSSLLVGLAIIIAVHTSMQQQDADPVNTLPVNNKMNSADSVHKIGDKFGGGVVFYVTDGGKHGLIAATIDQSARITWSNGTNKLIGRTADELGTGLKNTVSIIAAQENDKPYANFAAKICADYTVKDKEGMVYDDWYLPSRHELHLLFLNFTAVGEFQNYYYWSSTEANAETAWIMNFHDGNALDVPKADDNSVRAIRAF